MGGRTVCSTPRYEVIGNANGAHRQSRAPGERSLVQQGGAPVGWVLPSRAPGLGWPGAGLSRGRFRDSLLRILSEGCQVPGHHSLEMAAVPFSLCGRKTSTSIDAGTERFHHQPGRGPPLSRRHGGKPTLQGSMQALRCIGEGPLLQGRKLRHAPHGRSKDRDGRVLVGGLCVAFDNLLNDVFQGLAGIAESLHARRPAELRFDVPFPERHHQRFLVWKIPIEGRGGDPRPGSHRVRTEGGQARLLKKGRSGIQQELEGPLSAVLDRSSAKRQGLSPHAGILADDARGRLTELLKLVMTSFMSSISERTSSGLRESLPGASRLHVNGERYFVRDSGGSGSAVLLLHGWPDDSTIWRHQLRFLDEQGFRAIAVDWLGHGESSKPNDRRRYSTACLARDTVDLLDELGVDRAHLVAHDYGATVSWETAAHYPERFITFTAISVGHSAEVLLDVMAGGWMRYHWLLLHGLDFSLGWYLAHQARRFHRRFESHPDADYVLSKLRGPGDKKFFTLWEKANPAHEVLYRLLVGGEMGRRIEVPTQAIYSRDDEWMTEGQIARSYRHVNAEWRYHTIQGGHWIPLQDPAKVNAILLHWLRTHDSRLD